MKQDYREKFEGNTLRYWTAGQVGAVTVFASMIATGTESSDTDKIFPLISGFGLYAGLCGGFGYPMHVDKGWIEDHPELKSVYTPAPETPEEKEKVKKDFHEVQQTRDRASTILSMIMNIGNGLSAREEASRIVGFTGALINLTYYLLDPNDVRDITSKNNISFYLDSMQHQANAGVSISW